MRSTSDSQGWLLLWNCENLSTSSKKNLVLEVADTIQKPKGPFRKKSSPILTQTDGYNMS
jgi:hypothetical protein